jgi:antirestriction protein ArdC
MLWSAAMEKGCAAPVWMTYKQASEQKANVREGEHGGLVVYADKIVRTETDATGLATSRGLTAISGASVSAMKVNHGRACRRIGFSIHFRRS